MKIAFLAPLRNHQFDMVPYMLQQGIQVEVFTAFPKWKLKHENIALERIKTFPWLMVPKLGLQKFGMLPIGGERFLNWNGQKLFDLYVRHQIAPKKLDIVEAMSCYGFKTGRLVQQQGGKYVVHRGSAHAVYQEQILQEECKAWGVPFIGTDPRIIAQELIEYEQADLINVPSEYARQSFITQGADPTKVISIPYGVNLTHFHPVATPKPHGFTVLFVGQISLRKGVPYLLQAFNKVKHPQKELLLVGEITDDMRQYLRNYYNHGSGTTMVKFVGRMPRMALNAIMSKAHVMVLPSIDDGFGKVITEAMACGCPVICSTNTGGYGYLEDGVDGFVVPIRAVDAIWEKLQLLAESPDLQKKLAQTARAKVKNQAGWLQYVNNFIAICKKLA